MSKIKLCQAKKDSEFHWNAWPQPLTQACMLMLPLPRTDQFCTMRLLVKKLPGKRRNWSTVPLAAGVDARLTHGLTTMSSNQFRIT